MHLCNTGQHLLDYTAVHTRRLELQINTPSLAWQAVRVYRIIT
jgi:hypothetical protein